MKKDMIRLGRSTLAYNSIEVISDIIGNDDEGYNFLVFTSSGTRTQLKYTTEEAAKEEHEKLLELFAINDIRDLMNPGNRSL